MNESMRQHNLEAIRKGVRLDGRKLDEFRPIRIETKIIRNAEGSAKVRCGDTEVIAGVKLNLGTPFADRPENGALMVNAEMLPISNPKFESGPPGIDAIEISRIIDRGIRESKSIDEKKLCVKAGEKVWIANIDIYPLNYDGNMIDVGGLAAIAAARTTVFPSLVDGKADYKHLSKDPLPITCLPIPVTVVKVGENFLVDPTDEEMAIADARLTVTTIDSGEVCSLQKGGDGPLTLADISRMIDISIAKGKELRKLLR